MKATCTDIFLNQTSENSNEGRQTAAAVESEGVPLITIAAMAFATQLATMPISKRFYFKMQIMKPQF